MFGFRSTVTLVDEKTAAGCRGVICKKRLRLEASLLPPACLPAPPRPIPLPLGSSSLPLPRFLLCLCLFLALSDLATSPSLPPPSLPLGLVPSSPSASSPHPRFIRSAPLPLPRSLASLGPLQRSLLTRSLSVCLCLSPPSTLLLVLLRRNPFAGGGQGGPAARPGGENLDE